MLEQCIRQFEIANCRCSDDPSGLCSNSMNRVQQERVVVEIGRESRAAILVNGEQAAVSEKCLANEVDSGRCSIEQVLTLQRLPRNRESADGERIPRGELFLVASGRYALAAFGE